MQSDLNSERGPRKFVSLESFLDWLAPIVVVIVIGSMLFALIGAILAPVE